LPFDPEIAGVTEYPITTYQPLYFVAESFVEMKKMMQKYSATLGRPFSVRYNSNTHEIEFLTQISLHSASIPPEN